MVSGISIIKLVLSVLIRDPEINKKLGNRISPLIAENETKAPFIVLERTGVDPMYSKDGLANDEVTFSVKIVSSTYFASVDLAERSREVLERSRGLGKVRLLGISENYTDDEYVQELMFKTII